MNITNQEGRKRISSPSSSSPSLIPFISGFGDLGHGQNLHKTHSPLKLFRLSIFPPLAATTSVTAPGRRIHTQCFLDTFHTSISMPQLRFHPSKALCFSILRRWAGSDSSPLRKPPRLPPSRAYRTGGHAESESPVLEPRHWIEGWKGSRGPNQPKKPQSLVDYRRHDADSSEDDGVGSGRGGGGSTMDRIKNQEMRV